MIKSVSVDSSRVLIDFTYDKGCSGVAEEASAELDRSGNIKEGMKRGAAIGVAFAGYSAWLGPLAPYVTFAEALVPAVVPLALVGGVVGAFWKVNSDRDKRAELAKRRQEVAEDLYRTAMDTIRQNAAEIERSLHSVSDEYYRQQCREREDVIRSHHFDFADPAYGRFMDRLDRYIAELSQAAEACREEVQLPLEQGLGG